MNSRAIQIHKENAERIMRERRELAAHLRIRIEHKQDIDAEFLKRLSHERDPEAAG
jgi:plasmid maintenance system antidote protein VapI